MNSIECKQIQFNQWKTDGLLTLSAYNFLIGEKSTEKVIDKKKSEKKISISITTHNRCELLLRLIKSIFRQNYSNYEIIIIDDASSDGTSDQVEELIQHNPDKKLIYHRNDPNRGVTYSKRKGYELSTGDIIIFTDDDDFYIDADYFKKINLIYLNNSDCIMTVASTVTHDEKNDSYHLDLLNFDRPLTNSEYLSGFMTQYVKPNSMFTLSLNAEKMKEIHFEELKCFNDCSLYMYGLLADGKVYPIKEAVGVYSKQVFSMSSGISSTYTLENVEAKVDIGEKANRLGIITDKNRWIYKQCSTTLDVFFNGNIKKKSELYEIVSWVYRKIAFPYSARIILNAIKSRLAYSYRRLS